MYINNLKKNEVNDNYEEAIAIIGMSGRFPGANSVEKFWENISNGVCSIKFFDKQTLNNFGIHEEQINHPHYVNASGIIEELDKFDEKFFGYFPLEASVLDPQHRIFLEIVHEALENAGYASGKCKELIGVFAGTNQNSYFTNYVASNHEIIELFGLWEAQIATSPHLLANRVAYKLNLSGPCLNINTTCSTSLASVAVACEYLENLKCDIAIAGGVHLILPDEIGYLYREGGILSVDGYCRAFDKKASGTVPGSGAGVIILKRLGDALKSRDNILAIIKGHALNNDGSNKAGFVAPSVEGQKKCITQAQIKAKVLPHTINYIEAHGTGTQLGDSIEIQALKEVFTGKEITEGFCALGTVKPNIGHADAASGIIGLIKVILCLKNKKLAPHIGTRPSSLNEELEKSPFFINTALANWQRVNSSTPLRAGVSSFGIGGTNVHVIVEEADLLPSYSSTSLNNTYILICSAKSKKAFNDVKNRLLKYMKQSVANKQASKSEFANFIYTLQVGREDYLFRLALCCKNFENAIELLEKDINKINSKEHSMTKFQGTVFMFPGQATQYVNVARKLYERESFFKSLIDECCDKVLDIHGINIKNNIFCEYNIKDNIKLQPHTQHDQLSLFIIEYSLASLLMHWGIVPTAMIGHSLGEYVAACLSGVMTLSEALKIIFWRGKFMHMVEKGVMIAVPLSPRDITPFLNNEVSLAAINAPSLCVLSGSTEGVAKFQSAVANKLEANDLGCKLLRTSHAFHSFMMEGAAKKLKDALKEIEFKEPKIPYISNLTGTWISNEIINNKDYWIDHLCKPIKFSNGIRTLQESGIYIYAEVGPGSALSSFVRLHFQNNSYDNTIQIFNKYHADGIDEYDIYAGLADLWVHGAYIDWQQVFFSDDRRRIPLPTYPYDKRKHWIDNKVSPKSCITANHLGEQNSKIVESIVEPAQNLMNNGKGTSNKIEENLVEIWELIFGIHSVGIFDDFFKLGGHSLTAIQLVSLIRKKFSIDIPLKHIFENPNIFTLAKCIQHIMNEKNQYFLPPIVAKPYRSSAPLSSIQEQFWFLEKMAGEKPLYNLSTTFWLKGKLDINAFTEALDMLIKRHTVLGSTLELINNVIVQIITNDFLLSSFFELFDLSTLSEEDKNKEILRLNQIEINKPFNFTKGPLIRSQLISLSIEEHLLTISVHHAACDGWSLNILFKELSEIYNAHKANRDPILPNLPVQYADFAEWQQNLLPKEIIKKQLAYWERKLKGVPPLLKLPIDKPRPQKQNYKGAFYCFSLPELVLKNIKNLAEKYNATFFMTILSALSVLLHGYCNQNDIVVGTPIANRHYTNVEGLIGCFLNMLSLRIDCEEKLSFIELLQQIRQVTLEAYENRDVPFRQIINHLQIERSLSWSPVFQVILYMQTNDSTLFMLDGVEAQVSSQETGLDEGRTSKFDLTLWFQEEKGKLLLGFEYATELFEKNTIKKMASNLKKLLENIAINQNQSISKLISKLKINESLK